MRRAGRADERIVEVKKPPVAIGQRDYPVLQGYILFIALIYSLINLVVDLLYGVIDPRVRLA